MEQFCRARTDHLAYILGNFVLIFDFIELLGVLVSLFVLVAYKYISMIGSSSLVSMQSGFGDLVYCLSFI